MAETRPDQVAEPRTEAGRRLLDELALSAAANAYGHDAQGEGVEYALRSIRRVLPAIETEARTEAVHEVLARLAEQVRGLPLYQNGDAGVTTTETTTARLREYRAAVLSLLSTERATDD